MDGARFANALSFVFSALCISRLFLPGRGFHPPARSLTENDVVRPWHEYVEGLRYMRSVPLIMGLAMVGVLAGVLPARKAASVEPMQALRIE